MSKGKICFLTVLCAFFLVNPLSNAAVESALDARDLVLDTLLQGEAAGRRLMVLPEMLTRGTAVPTWHGNALVAPSDGFVVFVDDFAFANFEHPCRYVFVDRDTGELSVTPARTPPMGMDEWLELETAAYRALMRAENVRASRAAEPAPPRTTSRGGEYYAVLMSGGYDSGNNHVRYWNDLSNIYITLVDVYGYKDQNIIVLCSDGLDPAPDQSNGQNSHPDLDGDGDDDIMYSCVLSNIQFVFNQLATTLTVDDQLFVFTTDHGGSNGGWSTYLNLWNYESLTDAQLETMMAALPQCDMISTMEQCYSGGFEDNISVDPGRVFSSACAYNELSYAMPPDYVYDTYVFFWTAAVKGEDAYGVSCNADLNGDNLVSMVEAFLYAEAHDISSETPQYNDNPAGLGDYLFLGPGPALVMKFPAGLPGGTQPPGPENLLSLEIEAGLENYVPGSGYLHYRFDPVSSYIQVPLTPLGGDLFEVTLPGTKPGDEPEFYFSALGDLGSTVLSPSGAPVDVYSFEVCLVETLFHDNFESDFGWTVIDQNITTGTWERCVPNPTSGSQVAPLDDNPAGTGTYCFVTENGPPNATYSDHDIDGGPTILISPRIDLSSGDAEINTYTWFYGRDGDDPFHIDVSNDDGATWTNVYTTTASLNGWVPIAFRVGDHVAPTNSVRVRYSAQDNPNNSITEAGVDDFEVRRLHFDPSVWANAYSIEGTTGGVVDFFLNAGPAFANREYLLAGSFSGTLPGTKLPGGLVIPLNRDGLTDYIRRNLNTATFQNFMVNLDGQGKGTATLDTLGPLSPQFIGRTMSFAFTLTGSYDFVSNPIDVRIE